MTARPERPRRLTRPTVIGAVTVSVAAVVGLLLIRSAEPATTTSRVERGSVVSRVSASGALTALSSQSLHLPEGSRITEVLVKVGDHVAAGQPLAKVDNFGPQQELNQKLADLRRQQAELDKVVKGVAVPSAQAALEQNRKIFSATQRSIEATKRANESATERAEVQLRADQRLRDSAKRELQQCLDAPPTTTAAAPPVTSSASDPAASDPAATDRSERRRGSTGSASRSGNTFNTSCHDEQASADGASRQVVSSQTALESARQREKTDAAAGRLTIENARQSVVSSQSSVDSARADRPASIAAQAAALDGARIEVAKAQHELAKTELTAPADGTVSSLNGTVGDVVGSTFTGATLAPGSSATLPADITAEQTGTDPSGGPATRPFIVLSNLNTFQVVVPFTEADAVRIGPERPVKVTFDAIPGLAKDGRVLAVAPTPRAAGGAVSYLATIMLTDTDPRLRDGLSATAAVVAGTAPNVLTVPNGAVVRQADRAVVNVPGPDGSTREVTFQPGMAGDERTEVLGGLREGEQVLVSPTSTTSVAHRSDG